MRRIALINQKGGVGKTTTTVNLGAALALAGKRVVVVDLDPQANLTVYLGIELAAGAPSSYRVLTGELDFGSALRTTSIPNLRVLPTDMDLSGAELELSALPNREKLLRDALEAWSAASPNGPPADYVLFDCPPSLGLLSLNALAAADEVFLVVQTQFLALQGMSKLVEVIELVKKKLHPALELTGIVPCMYDSRMRLAREVLAELRQHFPAQTFRQAIGSNVKLAESPSFGKTIFEYAPDSTGARDFSALAFEVLAQEAARQHQVKLAAPPGPRTRVLAGTPSPAARAAATPTPVATPAPMAAPAPKAAARKAPAPVSKPTAAVPITPAPAAKPPAPKGAAPALVPAPAPRVVPLAEAARPAPAVAAAPTVAAPQAVGGPRRKKPSVVDTSPPRSSRSSS